MKFFNTKFLNSTMTGKVIEVPGKTKRKIFIVKLKTLIM